MSEYKVYSKDLWDYLGDMPYMPSRIDRDKLIESGRDQIWDYFFRIKPEDVGKPQNKEIVSIESEMVEEINQYRKIQEEINSSIENNNRIIFRKRIRVFLYGSVSLVLSALVSWFIYKKNLDINLYLYFSIPIAAVGLLLWLSMAIVGQNEKRGSKALKSQLTTIGLLHGESIKTKVERKNYLKQEIKELRKRIPKPPSTAVVSQWLFEHLAQVVEDAKIKTGLIGKDLVNVDGPNPIPFSGPGELQDPKRFPPTFNKFRASDDENFDIKKHLIARRAFVNPSGEIDVLYGMYYLECILIARDMLATYGLFYDFITGKSHAIETTEQYYDDVVAIVITNEFRWIKKSVNGSKTGNDIYVEDAPTFTMSLASGESRTVTFVNDKYFLKIKDEIGLLEEDISNIFLIKDSKASSENAIRALRKQLRTHKIKEGNG